MFMMDFILLTIIIALFSCFVILFIEKIGYRELMQVRAPKLIAELFSCDFCLSWWTNLIVTLVFCVMECEWYFICCAVAATPITRKLL